MPEREGEPELLLLDVYALVYRAYFALPPLTTSAGVPVNAVYGFDRMLNRVLGMERPTHIAACFDAGIPQERFDAMPSYKAQRPDMPDDLRPQFESVRAALDAYGIRAIHVEGEEADDCIATLSTRASRDGIFTSIITGDLDLLQLVDDWVTVVVTRRGMTDMTRYDTQAVRERFGLDPGQLPDYRGLKGDPSDNLPGVPGIGEKTAAKLIAQFGTLDALLEHTAEVTPKRIAGLLDQYADQARRCRAVSTAKRDLPIDVGWDELKYETPPRERLAKFYEAFEFRALSSGAANGDPKSTGGAVSVSPAVAPLGVEIPTRYRTLEDSRAAEAIDELRKQPAVGIALVAGNDGDAAGLAFCASPGDAFVVPESSVLRHAETSSAVKSLLESREPRKSVHDSKTFYAWADANGQRLADVGFDTMLGAGLVDPTLGEPSLAEAARMSGVVVTLVDKPKAPAAMDMFATPASLDPAFASSADAVFRAAPVLERMIEDAGESSLLRDVELPLARILAKMESCGFALDLKELDRIRAELDGMIAKASAEIFESAGEEFNLNSPKAVGAVLFEKMSLPGGIKKKTGYATGIEILGPLAAEHPIAAKILEYREVAKLKSTYVDALPSLLNPKTGCVHTTFHQLGAATGRLSSTNPNLQNIPVRTAAGKAIRRAFVPRRPDMALVAADYSQIELRLFAHFSQDENLLAAFAEGHDAHAYTARRVFGVPDDAPLDPELRRRAKAINFGVLYGMGSFGLAQSAGITRAEAREFIAQYFARFPRIKGYIDAGLAKARTDGFVATILGRRRYLPDLRSNNHSLRAAAERMAINAPLQGSAADLVKLAMVRVARGIEAAKVEANMLVQVHDELIFETPTKEISRLRAVVEDAMENAMSLRVPLAVHFSSGPTWADLE